MPTYPLRKVQRSLKQMGATFQQQKGRKHATVQYGGCKARWPNPHDDPIDEWLLSQLLKQLGISRKEFFEHYQ